MTEHSAFAMGWISGLCMGMGLMKLAWEREMRYQRRRAGPGHEPLPPSTPAPGMRRVYYDMPSTIAECGGPCSFGGPELCDCGALWRDVPTTPKPDIVPKPQYPGGYISLDGAQPFRVRRMPQPLPDELDAYTYQRGPEGDTPNPPPEVP